MKQATDSDGTKIHLIGNLRTDDLNRQFIVMEDCRYPISTSKPIQAEPEQLLVLEGIWREGSIEVHRPPAVLRPAQHPPSPSPAPSFAPLSESRCSPKQEVSRLVSTLVNKMRASPTLCPICQTALPLDTETCPHCPP